MVKTRSARQREEQKRRQAIIDAGWYVFRQRQQARRAVANRAAKKIQRAWRASLRPVTRELKPNRRVHRSRVVRDPHGRSWNARNLVWNFGLESNNNNSYWPNRFPHDPTPMSSANRKRVLLRAKKRSPARARNGRS